MVGVYTFYSDFLSSIPSVAHLLIFYFRKLRHKSSNKGDFLVSAALESYWPIQMGCIKHSELASIGSLQKGNE